MKIKWTGEQGVTLYDGERRIDLNPGSIAEVEELPDHMAGFVLIEEKKEKKKTKSKEEEE
tara:strand:+ start:451 stop:630 length:180 start_codon:yes stop_codon:yes gene_type:complete